MRFIAARRRPMAQIRAALVAAPDIGWVHIGNVSTARGRAAVADLMAYMTAQDGIVALFQGAAETGPRALGHRSILANPCNPRTREVLNARVKYREAIRPLAPMMTREAAEQWFELSEGASDADYNAYNYMVLTAPAKPEAHARHSIGDPRRRQRPPADRARAHRSPDARLSQGARPPHRGRGRGEHLVQCRRSDRADAGAGARDAAAREGHGCRGDGRGRRPGLRGLAPRSARAPTAARASNAGTPRGKRARGCRPARGSGASLYGSSSVSQ